MKNYLMPDTPDAADPRRWLTLGLLLLANFMNLIDVTIVNVALPSLQRGLGADPSQIEWVVAAYVLAFALGLLPLGRLGDIVGRKQMFVLGVGAFTLASALCGLAPNIEVLIGARIFQGLAGAMMSPQVLAIVQVLFPPQEKGAAFSFFGLSAGLASVTGPLLGGWLISMDISGLDWRPIFLVNVPIGVVAVIAGQILIHKMPGQPQLKNDLVGIVVFSIAVLFLIFPLVEGRTYGWPAWAFGMLVASVVVMFLFYLWQKHRDRQGLAQLMPVSLLENRNFLVGAVLSLVFFSAIPGLFFMLAMFLQSGFGLSPLASGLTTVPFPIGVLLASLVSGRLGSRFLRQRLAIGSAVLAVGILFLRGAIGAVGDEIDHWQFVLPLVVAGFGMGIGVSALFQTILAGIPGKDAGAGSGALQSFQQIGGAFGIAMIGEIFFSSLGSATAAGTEPHAAFVNAASNGTLYQITAFVIVVLLVPFLGSPSTRTGGSGNAPVVIEA